MKLSPRCPAAELLAGPPLRGPSVICRVLTRDAEAVDKIEEAPASPLITARDDGSTFFGFCCGPGLPKVYEGQRPRAHYTFCPIWEAAEAAARERKERVFDAPEQEKLLGEDPEVLARILDMDVEEVERAEVAHRERTGQPPLGPKTTTGIEAMEEVVNDPEWEESS